MLRREKIKKREKHVDCQGYLWAEFTHIAFNFPNSYSVRNTPSNRKVEQLVSKEL